MSGGAVVGIVGVGVGPVVGSSVTVGGGSIWLVWPPVPVGLVPGSVGVVTGPVGVVPGSVGVGSGSVGLVAVGASVGKTSVGWAEVGSTSVGRTSVGKTSVGWAEVGSTSVGRTSVGRTSVGRTEVGKTSVGKTEVGSTSVGRISVGKISVGRISVGRIWVGSSVGRVNGGRSLEIVTVGSVGRGTSADVVGSLPPVEGPVIPSDTVSVLTVVASGAGVVVGSRAVETSEMMLLRIGKIPPAAVVEVSSVASTTVLEGVIMPEGPNSIPVVPAAVDSSLVTSPVVVGKTINVGDTPVDGTTVSSIAAILEISVGGVRGGKTLVSVTTTVVAPSDEVVGFTSGVSKRLPVVNPPKKSVKSRLVVPADEVVEDEKIS